jgi:Secretion system C-terminal sorting domain
MYLKHLPLLFRKARSFAFEKNAKLFVALLAIMSMSINFLSAQATIPTCTGAAMTAPKLQTNVLTNVCPAVTVNLNPELNGTLPAGTTLVWYRDSLHAGIAYATPTAATKGIYYAFFNDAANNCISKASEPLAVAITSCSGCGDNENLIFNGDFELGKIGFEHNYLFFKTTPTACITDFNTGTFTLQDDSNCKLHAQFAFWATPADHTTSCQDGKYMFIQGGVSAVPANQMVWKQTVKGLTPGKKYTFSFWAHDNVMNFAVPASYPGMSASIDSALTFAQDTFPYLSACTQKNWEKYSKDFTADADGKAVFKIFNRNQYNFHGNDWILDDVSLVAFCGDYDSDGISDNYDLDDDNDGIKDKHEGAYSSMLPAEVYGTFGNLAPATRANLTTAPVGYTYEGGTAALAPGKYAVVAHNGAVGLDGFSAFTQVMGHTTGDSADAYLAINQGATPTKFFVKPFTITTAGSYKFGAFTTNAVIVAGYPVQVGVRIKNATDTLATATSCIIPSFSNAAFYNWVEVADTVNLAAGTYTIEVYNLITTTATAAGFAIDDIYVRPTNKEIVAGILDTDGDGLANYLDLDSDGDGLTDAVEGNAPIAATSLVVSTMAGGNTGAGYTGTAGPINSTLCITPACVSTKALSLGIPTLAGKGQFIGTSQVAAPLVPIPCTIPAPKLVANSLTNLCPAVTVNLNAQLDGTLPTNTKLVWHRDTLGMGTPYATPTAATNGIYYAFLKDTVLNCITKASEPLFVVITACSGCDNTNLIFNGDFELGKMGFEHNYLFFKTTPTACITDFNTGTFTLQDDSNCKLHAQFAFWATPADHTTSCQDGKYMFIQGGVSAVPANQMVWKQTVKGLTPGKKYTFSFWAHDNVMNFAVPASYPGMSASIDSALTFAQDTFPYLSACTQKNWEKYSKDFTADADGKAVFKIFNRNQYNFHGNDWILDDVSLVAFCGDYDSDGISDNYDLDDDNDGIKDKHEGAYSSMLPAEMYGTFGNLAPATRADLATAPVGYTYEGGTAALAAGKYAVVAHNGATGLNALGAFAQVMGHTTADSADAYLAISQAAAPTKFFVKPFTIATAGKYKFGTFTTNAGTIAGSPHQIGVRIKNATDTLATVTSCIIPSFSNAAFYNWVEVADTVDLAAGTYSIEVYNIITGTATAANFAIDDIYVRPTNVELAGVLNTDGDALSNYQDLDSDGDGCADAIEGSANLTAANTLVSTMAGGNTGATYTGTSGPVVNTLCATPACVSIKALSLGIPTLAKKGQFDRSSINAAVCIVGTDNIKTIDWAIVPNPSSQYFSVKGDLGNQFTVTIFDKVGRLVRTSQNETTISVADLASDVYVVAIKTANGTGIKKLVVLNN